MTTPAPFKKPKRKLKMLAVNLSTHRRVKRYAATHKLTMQQAVNKIIREVCR